MTSIPDHILEGCRKQERGAQEQLYRHCYGPFLRLCLRYAENRADAADILNKAFFNIFTHLDQYRGDGNVLGWMKRIVVNAAVDYIRSNKRFRYHEPVEAAAELPGQSRADHQLLQNDLLDLLSHLPFTSSAVFNLYVIEGYSHREIGAMLGITEGNSKWHLHHARQILQRHLTQTAVL